MGPITGAGASVTGEVLARAAATAPKVRTPGSFAVSLRIPVPALIGGVALLGAAGLGAWLLSRRGDGPPPQAPPGTPAPTAPGAPAPTAAPQPAMDVRVGQLNVKNLFDTVDDPKKQDDVPTAEEHAQHLRKLALTVRDVLHAPDVVALQEVENEQVLQELAAHPELAALGYRGIIHEGRDPRGIDVAMLYRGDRVMPVAVETWDPLGAAPSGRRTRTFTRPPLVVDFAKAGAPDGPTLRVASAHLTSRLQGADGERRRTDQSAALAAGIDAAAAGAAIVLAADLNMAPGEAPYEALVGSRDAATGPRLLEPLTAIAPEDRYSYRRGRTRELLDHVLVTPRPGVQASDPSIFHVNTEATAAAVRDVDHPAGASDHDPVVVRVRVAG